MFASFVFRSFDANEKGFVEFKEFLKCLSITSRGTAEERLECERDNKPRGAHTCVQLPLNVLYLQSLYSVQCMYSTCMI